MLELRRGFLTASWSTRPAPSASAFRKLAVCRASSQSSPTAKVLLRLPLRLNFGESVSVTGPLDGLGAWKPKNSPRLAWTEGHVWQIELDLPTETKVEYKYILHRLEGPIEWQPGSNLSVELPSSAATAEVQDHWKPEDGKPATRVTSERTTVGSNEDVTPLAAPEQAGVSPAPQLLEDAAATNTSLPSAAASPAPPSAPPQPEVARATACECNAQGRYPIPTFYLDKSSDMTPAAPPAAGGRRPLHRLEGSPVGEAQLNNILPTGSPIGSFSDSPYETLDSSEVEVLELTRGGSLKHLVGVDVIADELKDQGHEASALGEEPHHLEVEKLSTSEVRNLLRRRGLSVTGGRMQLVHRLKETGAIRS